MKPVPRKWAKPVLTLSCIPLTLFSYQWFKAEEQRTAFYFSAALCLLIIYRSGPVLIRWIRNPNIKKAPWKAFWSRVTGQKKRHDERSYLNGYRVMTVSSFKERTIAFGSTFCGPIAELNRQEQERIKADPLLKQMCYN